MPHAPEPLAVALALSSPAGTEPGVLHQAWIYVQVNAKRTNVPGLKPRGRGRGRAPRGGFRGGYGGYGPGFGYGYVLSRYAGSQVAVLGNCHCW